MKKKISMKILFFRAMALISIAFSIIARVAGDVNDAIYLGVLAIILFVIPFEQPQQSKSKDEEG